MRTPIKFLYSLIIASVAFVSFADDKLVKTVPSLTLDGAKVIAEASAAEADANGWNVIIAICDAAGYLKYLERMEDVQIGSLEIAIEKARTSAMFRRESKVFNDRVKSGDVPVVTLPNVLPFEGGIEIKVDGVVIGAIGVSGVHASDDARIARAGVNAFMKRIEKN